MNKAGGIMELKCIWKKASVPGIQRVRRVDDTRLAVLVCGVQATQGLRVPSPYHGLRAWEVTEGC